MCGDIVKPEGVSQFAESRLFIIKNTNPGKHFNNKEAAPWPEPRQLFVSFIANR